MAVNRVHASWANALKCGAALLPLGIALAALPAQAQTAKTQKQLEEEAAAASAAAAEGADADDAADIAAQIGGLTGTSTTAERSREIIVTGTNIRGVAPTGTTLTTITREDIQSTGQTSTTQLLAQIPGFSTFNTTPQIGSSQAAQGLNQTLKPNLRGTPDGDATGDTGNSTLLLVDGNRTSGAGFRGVSLDPDSIPSNLLERVELNTDGGSAAYGSDAIGGVVNFVTRRKYDGVELTGRLGYADDYWTYDGSVIAGKDWGSGSFYGFYSHAANTLLLNRDRSYYQPIDWKTGLETGTSCDLPNIQIASSAATGSGTSFVPALPAHFYRVAADGTVVRTGTTPPAGGLATSAPNAGQPSDASRPNLCSLGEFAARFPKNRRHSARLNFSQDITDDISFLARASYSSNYTYTVLGPRTLGATVTPNNPFYQNLVSSTGAAATYPTVQAGFPTAVSDANKNHTVLASMGPAFGNEQNWSLNKFKQYGGNAELTWRIDGNWQLKAYGAWDRSDTYYRYPGFVTTPYTQNSATSLCSVAVASFSAAGGHSAANAGTAAAVAAREAAKLVCINPYNVEASNPAILQDISNFDSQALAHDTVINFKANLDGALFTIPGGKVRIALGGEVFMEDINRALYTDGRPVPISGIRAASTASITPPSKGSRNVYSAYGEINVPLVSSANALTWMRELRLSVQGRYDRYSLFGDTFNPKVGVSYKPTDWLRVYGNWNKSFRAPSIINVIGLESTRITVVTRANSGLSAQTAAAIPSIDPNQYFWIIVAGTSPTLRPQTGRQWSLGFEITPFRGFRASANYGYIDYLDALGSPGTTTILNRRGSTAALASLGLEGLPGQGGNESPYSVVLDPRTDGTPPAGTRPLVALTPAQVQAAKQAFAALATNGDEVLALPAAQGGEPYGLYNNSQINLGNSKIANLDYRVSYNSRTPWGSVFFNVAGSVKLINKTQDNDTLPFLTNISGSRHALTATAGLIYGPLRASATLTHSDGYRVNRSATLQYDRVGDFNVVNTFFTWDMKGDNAIERGLQLSLTINNILNTSPPHVTSGTGTANGSTLGRLVQLGFTKKF